MQTINKGAPLDVAFVNDLVNTVEQLVADSTTSKYKRATIKDNIYSNGASTTVRTADARIHAETFYAGVLQDVAPGQYATFELPLTNFLSAPVVTVTPILTNPGTTKADISAVITSVNTSRVVGYVVSNIKLDSTQQIALSLVAVGVPTN